MHYFSTKKSPTDTLLLYLEAINFLRSANNTFQNKHKTNNNIEQDINLNHDFLNNQYYANEIFSNYFINYFTEKYKTKNAGIKTLQNEDEMIKNYSIYANN